MDMTTTEPTVYTIQGWQKPAWATEVTLDHNIMHFRREAKVQPMLTDTSDLPTAGDTYSAQITLSRYDDLVVDPDSGVMTVTMGPVVLFLGDIEELPPEQGPALVAAVHELLDALAAGDSE